MIDWQHVPCTLKQNIVPCLGAVDLVEGGVVAADDAGVVTRHAAVDLALEKSLIKDDKIKKKVVPANTNDKATSLSSFV